MILESFSTGPFNTNAYLIGCEEKKVGAFIDPAPGSNSNLKKSADSHALIVESIFLTHTHWDHIGDVALLKKEFGLKLYVHIADVENLRNPGSDGLPLMTAITGVEPDEFLKEGEKLQVGNLTVEVIHTPGHTPGGVCFYIPKEKILLSGDTLFRGSIGNLSFPTADSEAMWTSLKKLAKLPSDTVVYPGHGPKTTIGIENWLERARQIFS